MPLVTKSNAMIVMPPSKIMKATISALSNRPAQIAALPLRFIARTSARRFLNDDHPVDAELVLHHAEQLGEESLDQRLADCAAVGESIEVTLAIHFTICGDGEREAVEFWIALGHAVRDEDRRIAELELRVHHVVLVGIIHH